MLVIDRQHLLSFFGKVIRLGMRVLLHNKETKTMESVPVNRPTSQYQCTKTTLPFYIPLNKPTLKECKRQYRLGRELGKGSYGVVYIACRDPDDCKYVLKMILLTDDTQLSTAEREQFFGRLLNDSGLSVRFLDGWRCGGNAFLVFERMDGDMLQLGRRQAQRYFGIGTNTVVYTPTQLRKMAGLAVDLSKHEIVHGDLQLANLLFQSVGSSEVVKAGDFGKAGDFNTFLPGQFMICSNAEDLLNQKLRDVWMKYHNLWYLERDLFRHQAQVVIDPKSKRISSFTGFVPSLLPAEVRSIIDEGYRYARKPPPVPLHGAKCKSPFPNR